MGKLRVFPQKTRDLAWRIIDDETILLSFRGKRVRDVVYTLNSTATYIWKLIDGKHSPEDIAGRIVDKYGISPRVALAKLRALMKDLSGRGYIYYP